MKVNPNQNQNSAINNIAQNEKNVKITDKQVIQYLLNGAKKTHTTQIEWNERNIATILIENEILYHNTDLLRQVWDRLDAIKYALAMLSNNQIVYNGTLDLNYVSFHLNTEKNFSTLLRNYEIQTRNRTPQTETEYTNALQELATACTYSVLKKLCNVGGYVDENTKTPTDTVRAVRQLRQSIAIDQNNLNRLTYSINNSTQLRYNKEGEVETVVADKEMHQAITELLNHCIGEGIDLINTAVVTILNETAKTTDLTADFMETPYTVRRLKRKVYIQDVNSLGGYENVTTTAIQEVYKAIRRDIESNRAMQIASNKYTYISDILTDTESETETEVFRRLPKFSGLAYEMTEYRPTPTNPYGGKITGITADIETITATDNIIAKMNLTAKQATILQLRLSGYGYESIATYLGIKEESVRNSIKYIQKKAIAIGLEPTTTTAYIPTEKKRVKQVLASGDVVIYDSISQASKITGYDKGNISKGIRTGGKIYGCCWILV